MKAIEQRLAMLEQRRSVKTRRIHIIKGTDHDDSMRQIADLMAASAVNDGDGFLCLTGAPSFVLKIQEENRPRQLG
jgi:hypothetical protein